jgi:hypothetical protein
MKLNRWKAMWIGTGCGALGALAMRWYWRNAADAIFPHNHELEQRITLADQLPEISPLFGRLYRPHEAAGAAAGRVVYEAVTGREADENTQAVLYDAVWIGWGMLFGGLYGLTRTATRPRDIAGGFFYGLRLYLGNTVMAAILGLRAHPRAFTRRQHLIWLTGTWVYSFTTTNLTRLVYWLSSQEDV